MDIDGDPKRALIMEAARERKLADSPEGQALLSAIDKAVNAYSDFLDRNGLIWEDRGECMLPRLKAQALVVTLDYGDGDNAVDISLKDGPLDRVYGNGVNPDPECR